MENLKQDYFILKNKYIQEFEKKQGMRFLGELEDDILPFGDFYISYEDVRLDIDKDVRKGEIIKWYDASLNNFYKYGKYINYSSYLMGRKL